MAFLLYEQVLLTAMSTNGLVYLLIFSYDKRNLYGRHRAKKPDIYNMAKSGT